MMKITPVIFLSILGVSLGLPLNQDLEKANAACISLCQNCDGDVIFQDDVCVCKIMLTDTEVQCSRIVNKNRKQMKRNARRVSDFELLNAINHRARRALLPDTNYFKKRQVSSTLRRTQRSIPPSTVYRNAGYYGPPHMIPGAVNAQHPSVISPKGSAMYEIFLGNSGEDTIQLVFPQSDGLEVEHQFFYLSPDGSEHPYSDPVKEPNVSDFSENINHNNAWSESEDYASGNKQGLSKEEEDHLETPKNLEETLSWEENQTFYPSKNIEEYHSEEGYRVDERRWGSTELDVTDEKVNSKGFESEEYHKSFSDEEKDDVYRYDEEGYDYGTASTGWDSPTSTDSF